MTTTPAPIPTIPSLEAGLTLLAANLVLATRTDGTEYRMLREDCPMHDDLRAIIRDAHNGEIPNDWRFGMVYDLCHALLDYSQPQACAVTADDCRDYIGDIVATQGDTSTYALLVWLSDNVSRCHFDDAEVWCSGENGSDIGALAHHRQMEEIKWMAHAILSGLEALVSA
jgi:hypothetical protein